MAHPLRQEYYEPLDALNLGMSGDRTEHLLWRLQNGELPDSLQPKVRAILNPGQSAFSSSSPSSEPDTCGVVNPLQVFG